MEKKGYTWPPELPRGPSPPPAAAAAAAPHGPPAIAKPKVVGSTRVMCESSDELVDSEYDGVVNPLMDKFHTIPTPPNTESVPDIAGRVMNSCPARPAEP